MKPTDAFELACELAITAPTSEKSRQATALAEEIAMLLTPQQVEQVKRRIEYGENQI